ncbi:MAG: invasion protein CiaB [Sulfurovum sp.]|nr:invasion protein CiaB [Sulfurovum sp.]
MQDLQKIYDELQSRQSELNNYYSLVDDKGKTKGHNPYIIKASQLVDSFLNLLDIEKNDDTTMAALTRIINLREDALDQVLSKLKISKDEIIVKKELAYGFVRMMHLSRHGNLVKWVENEKLLTPFYRSLILGVHLVGGRLSEWQSHWTGQIINGINVKLSEQYGGDDAKVFEMLREKSLLDLDENGQIGDRCYSVLEEVNGKYRSIAYADAFPVQVAGTVQALDKLMAMLEKHEDEVFGHKDKWLAYFTAIKIAFSEKHTADLIKRWTEVDRKWMAIKTPIQVGHPLEYYEDHYRKAVALEWDLRIVNPSLQVGSPTRQNIKDFASAMAEEFGAEAQKTMAKNLTQVDETQLYIGQPILYYAAEFNGLFSAQVVPNDEGVSVELGKKIFAYADFVMESKKSKPIMRLSVETMGEEFVKKQKALVDSNPKLWQEVYDISTVGHEYGHILWIDSDTETKMNGRGQFKNIEEFKATSGGLMAFFHNEREELKEHVINDVVSRAVGLMAWREVGEVLPYYCEGLIHLDILFGSAVITYDNEIKIDYSKYDVMKEAYISAYKNLARNYLKKIDASEYLEQYAIKSDGIYLPKDEKIKSFVEHYYARYKEIGQQTVNLDE